MTDQFNNPYAPPVAVVKDAGSNEGNFLPEGRTVPAGNGFAWIGSAWSLFKEAPGAWIGMFILFLIIWFVVAIVPLVNMLTVLLLPLFMGGFIIAAHNQRENGTLSIGDLFAGFQQKAGPLIIVGLLTFGLTLVAMIPVGVLILVGGFAAFAGGHFDMSNLGAMLGSFGIAVVIGVALMSLVYAAMWFAPALVVMHDVAPFDAMKASFKACFRNWLAGLLYFILAMILLIAACIPLGLGLLVMGPVMYASIYTSYRDIFVEE